MSSQLTRSMNTTADWRERMIRDLEGFLSATVARPLNRRPLPLRHTSRRSISNRPSVQR